MHFQPINASDDIAAFIDYEIAPIHVPSRKPRTGRLLANPSPLVFKQPDDLGPSTTANTSGSKNPSGRKMSKCTKCHKVFKILHATGPSAPDQHRPQRAKKSVGSVGQRLRINEGSHSTSAANTLSYGTKPGRRKRNRKHMRHCRVRPSPSKRSGQCWTDVSSTPEPRTQVCWQKSGAGHAS